MASTERCPICNVSVKRENLLRHLNDTHPRHPDTPQIRERLKAEPGRAATKRAAPLRVRTWQVALVALIAIGIAGAYYVAPFLNPGSSEPFPCVSGTNYVYHWHTQLRVFSNGVQVTIPENVGIVPGCLEPIHTHDTSGLIHIETVVARTYSIGNFFQVWGKSFASPSQMLVNNTAVTASPNVVLYDQETIDLYYPSFT